MPRYFFNVMDGPDAFPDEDGTVLSDIYSAQAHAVTFAGEMLRDLGGKLWDKGEWCLEVFDDQRRKLFFVKILTVESVSAPVVSTC